MICNIFLKRVSSSPRGTFGVLIKDNIPLCLTAERPWNNNNHDTSCIPLGSYQCIPHNGEHFKSVWEVSGVPDREFILIHTGNNPLTETKGCILVGRNFFPSGVLLSKAALDDLRNVLPDNFTLTIGE